MTLSKGGEHGEIVVPAWGPPANRRHRVEPEGGEAGMPRAHWWVLPDLASRPRLPVQWGNKPRFSEERRDERQAMRARPVNGGGGKTGPNPTDRRKPGSKHHLIADAQRIPLAAILTGANPHDVTQLLPLV